MGEAVPHQLVDLLWRDHPAASGGRRRGPPSRLTTGAVVDAAIAIADRSGLEAVRIRELAGALGGSTMSIYTYVNSRADLLALMVDAAHAAMPRPDYGRSAWRTRVRRVADANATLYRFRPWLLDITDDRVAVGPGTIAKYDHELHAFDGTGLDDVDRDAALTFVLDFVRAGAAAARRRAGTDDPSAFWRASAPRLGVYLDGTPFPLAGRVGEAAGERMQAAYSAAHAYRFGMRRVLAALSDLVDPP